MRYLTSEDLARMDSAARLDYQKSLDPRSLLRLDSAKRRAVLAAVVTPASFAQASALTDVWNQHFDSGHPNTNVVGAHRADTDETMMLALQLQQLRAKVYEDLFAVSKARELFPVETDIDPGAEQFAYEESHEIGRAKVIRDPAQDAPSVESHSTKVVRNIVALGDSYFVSLQQLAAAMFAGKPLEARKAKAARNAWDRELDEICAYGSPADNIANGMANRGVGSGATQSLGTQATAADWTQSTVDPKKMLASANAAVADMITNSKERHAPNMLVLPTANYMTFSQTRISDIDSTTVLEAFLRANPMIDDVQPWLKLQGVDANVGGDGAVKASSDDADKTYSRALLIQNDADNASITIAQDFTVLPPQPQNFGFKMACYGRTAGAVVYRPLATHYLTGLPLDPTA